MKNLHCISCGSEIEVGAKFCTNCGANTGEPQAGFSQQSSQIIKQINTKIELKNNQTSIVRKLWYAAGFFLLILIIAFMDLDSIPIHPAIAFISFFLLLSSVTIAFMFKKREEKLQKLISGRMLLAEWTLTKEQKKQYANFLFKNEIDKNQIILFSIGFIAIIVFGLFILFIDEGKLAMFFILLGLLAFLTLFAFGAPFYYKIKNSKGDGIILIGSKYAYINGYFHNWDFPLSGLKKIDIIEEPFYGILLNYYYTDRTLKHSEELIIPLNDEIDIRLLVQKLKELN